MFAHSCFRGLDGTELNFEVLLSQTRQTSVHVLTFFDVIGVNMAYNGNELLLLVDCIKELLTSFQMNKCTEIRSIFGAAIDLFHHFLHTFHHILFQKLVLRVFERFIRRIIIIVGTRDRQLLDHLESLPLIICAPLALELLILLPVFDHSFRSSLEAKSTWLRLDGIGKDIH